MLFREFLFDDQGGTLSFDVFIVEQGTSFASAGIENQNLENGFYLSNSSQNVN